MLFKQKDMDCIILVIWHSVSSKTELILTNGDKIRLVAKKLTWKSGIMTTERSEYLYLKDGKMQSVLC